MKEILFPALIVGSFGLFFGILLSLASILFKVKKDERISLIEEALPGANCGGCGYAGCSSYAEAVTKGEAECDMCPVGGAPVATYISKIMGTKSEFQKKFAFIGCTGGAKDKYIYEGAPDCAYASMLMGGMKSCNYGCIGLGNCVKACPTSALRMEGGIPEVDEEKCTGCGKCMRICPRGLIDIIPEKAKIAVVCNSRDKISDMKHTCNDGCIACGKCVKICTNDAISVKDNLAKIDYQKCISCGKCIEVCPRHIIRYIRK